MNYSYKFKKGITEFHTPFTGTSDLPPKDVYSRIYWSNTPKRLKTFFFSKNVLKLIVFNNNIARVMEPLVKNLSLLKKEFKRNGKEIYLFSIMKPIAGYSEVALMSVVGRISQLTGNSFSNDLVYDYPPAVQDIYWKTSLDVIRKFCVASQKGQLPNKFAHLKPYLTGHHGRELSLYPPFQDNPGIRTVMLHHDHLVFVDEDRVKNESWDESMFNLDKEKNLFMRNKPPNLSEFVDNLNRDPRMKKHKLYFKVRNERPLGYSIQVDYSKRGLNELVKLLSDHFQVYSDKYKKSGLFHNSKLIQPIFTFYLIPKNDQKGLIVITPNIFASGNRVAGGPERTGLLFSRNPDIDPIYKKTEKDEFYKKIIN